MLYYKVFKDYTNYITIDERELEKALGAFKLGSPVIFNNGAIEKIESIIPDYNQTMGWNPSYKLGDDDWNEIRSKGVDKKIKTLIESKRDKIEFLLMTNQQHLIGKNVEVDMPENKSIAGISDLIESLSDKFRLN